MSLLRSISAPAEALLGSSALAHVVTVNRSGMPQVSVVWCGVEGDRVYFCSRRDSVKVRNLTSDPRILLSIEDEARNRAGTQRHLVVYGRARVVGDADAEICDRLCRIYTGSADHPANLKHDPTAVRIDVEVDRIGGNGPWTVA